MEIIMKTLIIFFLLLGTSLFPQITGNSVIDQNYNSLRQPPGAPTNHDVLAAAG